MRKLIRLLGLAAALAATTAQAQEPQAAAAGDAQDAAKDSVRRDPQGIKGISPFMEAILKGDRAYVARDFEGAIAAYRDAIQLEPQNALGHYRFGGAELAKGDQRAAEAAFVNGLRFTAKDGTLKAKLIFALADLRERQKNNDEAIARWKDYSKNVEEQREAITYPATASERITRNEGWKQLQADSAAVKERIDKRLKEAEDASRKSASDPKNK